MLAAQPAQVRKVDDLVGALLALGYRRPEAEAAAEEARRTSDVESDQLKLAIRALSRAEVRP